MLKSILKLASMVLKDKKKSHKELNTITTPIPEKQEAIKKPTQKRHKHPIHELVNERKAQNIPLMKIYQELSSLFDGADVATMNAIMSARQKIEDIMCTRNQKGIEYEKMSDNIRAINQYEANIKDCFDGSHPYERLRIIYSKQNNLTDVSRIFEAYKQNCNPDQKTIDKFNNILQKTNISKPINKPSQLKDTNAHEIIKMQNNEVIDPIQLSMDALCVVMFPKSKSSNYGLAVMIAQNANSYYQIDFNGTMMNVAYFDKTANAATSVENLIEMIKNWKGVFIFVKGKPLNNFNNISYILSCFKAASKSIDYKNHCLQNILDPTLDEEILNYVKSMEFAIHINIDVFSQNKQRKFVSLPTYNLPCKKFPSYISRSSFGSIDELIGKMEVEVDYWCLSLCPFFDLKNFCAGTPKELEVP